jgi:hypothetical protein
VPAPIAASTVRQILHDARIDPAPRRTGPTWKQLLTAQARGIIAVDSYPAIVDQPRRAPDPRKQILGGLTSEYQIAA